SQAMTNLTASLGSFQRARTAWTSAAMACSWGSSGMAWCLPGGQVFAPAWWASRGGVVLGWGQSSRRGPDWHLPGTMPGLSKRPHNQFYGKWETGPWEHDRVAEADNIAKEARAIRRKALMVQLLSIFVSISMCTVAVYNYKKHNIDADTVLAFALFAAFSM